MTETDNYHGGTFIRRSMAAGRTSPFPLRGMAGAGQIARPKDQLLLQHGAVILGDSQTAQTSIDFFMIFEWRDYCGEPAPLIGSFTGMKPSGVGEIRGRVFGDLNRNGLFDGSDKPLAGFVLRLDDGFVVKIDGTASYRFPNVASGEHRLRLDPASFLTYYINPSPDGVSVHIYPEMKQSPTGH